MIETYEVDGVGDAPAELTIDYIDWNDAFKRLFRDKGDVLKLAFNHYTPVNMSTLGYTKVPGQLQMQTWGAHGANVATAQAGISDDEPVQVFSIHLVDGHRQKHILNAFFKRNEVYPGNISGMTKALVETLVDYA